MNHLWLKFVLLCVIIGVWMPPLFAQSITIETLNRNADILLNGQRVSKELLYAFPVLEGRHLITVRDDGNTLFSRAYALRDGQDLIIHLSPTGDVRYEAITTGQHIPFPNREVLNIGGVMKAQGPVAIGIHYSETLHGFSYRHWLNRKFGIEGVGWATQSSNRYKDTVGARVLYSLLALSIGGRLSRYYVGTGFGNKFVASTGTRERDTMTEVFFGVELPSGHWRIMTYSVELAYEWVARNDDPARDNFRINVGSHFYVAGKRR